MYRRILVSAFTLLVITGCASAGPATVHTLSNSARADSARWIDQVHPKYFVRIEEVTRSGRRIPIAGVLDSVGRARESIERVHHEVDRFSKIEVQFDREWVATHGSGHDVQIMVTGRVEGESKRNIEVRNYALVGQQSTPTPVRLRSGQEVESLMAGLTASWDHLSSEIAEIRRLSVAAADQNIRTAEAALAAQEQARRLAERHLAEARSVLEREDSIRESLEIRRREIWERLHVVGVEGQQRLEQEHDRIAADIAARPSRETLRADFDTRREALRRTEENIESAQRTLDGLTLGPAHRADARQFVPRRRASVLERRAILEAPLRALTADDNRVLVDLVAASGSANAEQLVGLAQQVLDQWLPELERSHLTASDDPARLDRDFLVLESITHNLAQIGSVLRKGGGNSTHIARQLASYLKDTDLMVSETGAQQNESLILMVTNGVDRTDVRRDLEVRLRVRALGWVQSISDSFLLINRRGLHPRTNERRLEQARETILEAHRGGTVLARADTVLEMNVPVTYDPIPSFNLGWTYNTRYCTSHDAGWFNSPAGCWLQNAVRWIQPSVNLNVALARFGSQTVTLRRVLSADAPTATPEIIETTTDHRRGLDAGVGTTVGVFDNAVVFGYGRHLTALNHRGYWSLGFSFVRIVEGVVQAASR
jgi:hypothetical protein